MNVSYVTLSCYPSDPAKIVRPGLKGPDIVKVEKQRERERGRGKGEGGGESERDSDFVRQHPRAWLTGMVMVRCGNAGVRAGVPKVRKTGSRDILDDVTGENGSIHRDRVRRDVVIRVSR